MDSAFSTADWARLSDDQQLDIAGAALRVAIRTVAGQAELLAGEMESGLLLDRGGPDALRLLAMALRVSGEGAAINLPPGLAGLAVAGHA